MNASFIDTLLTDHRSCTACPSPHDVEEFFVGLLQVLFSDLADTKLQTSSEVESALLKLQTQLGAILTIQNKSIDIRNQAVEVFFKALPDIRGKLVEDAEAIEAGDPAAENLSEVIRTYPGFYAIASHRIAHQLWDQEIPLVPRMITEIAHTRTGVDIHPAAHIGRHFCIDHGTGIVIGATTDIGHHVKIYQGVTLGALSVRKEDADKKRHPTIEDHCILYSGATILGGKTIIGEGSIIGGNVWITKSVAAGSKIYYQAKIHSGQQADADFVLYKNDE